MSDTHGADAPSSSPTPSAPDATTSSPSSVESSAPASGVGESLDFESIFHDSSPDTGLEGLTEQPTVQQPQTPAPPPQAVQPAPAAPQPTPAQQQAPAQAPSQQPQRDASGIPPTLDRYDPAQLAQALAANEAALTDVLATQVMRLSPQEVEALESNVVEAIPRLMARVLVQAQRSALSQMANILPVAIQRHTETMFRATSAENTFYRSLPGLNPVTHGHLVRSYASVFRQVHPQATLQDLINHVGPMVMVAAGVKPGQQQQSGTVVHSAANGRKPPPSPFVPAAGAGPVSGTTRNDMTPWEAMFAQQNE